MMSKTAIYWTAGLGVAAFVAVTPAILKFYNIGWPGDIVASPALPQKVASNEAAVVPNAPPSAPAAVAPGAQPKPAEPAASAPAPSVEAPATPAQAAAPAPAQVSTPAAAVSPPKPPTPPVAAPMGAAKAEPPTASPSPQPAKADAQRPAFDVVRVEPTGDAVIAGRASPRAAVQLRSDGRVVAQVDADDTGQFAILPPPFPAGDHRLQLAARSGGEPEILSDAIGIQVPAAAEPARQGATASAKPATDSEKPAEIQHPAEAATPKAAAPTETPKAAPAPEQPKTAALGPAPSNRAANAPLVAILSVEMNGAGRFEAKGAAEPNALVRLYLNNAFVAEATAGADGRWSLTVERGMTPGPYAIRADQIDRANGAVVARAEAPFDYPTRPTGDIASATPPAGENATAAKPADQTAPATSATPAPPASASARLEAAAPSTTLPSVVPRPAAAALTLPKAAEAAAPAASAGPSQDQNHASGQPASNPAPSETPAPAALAAPEPAKANGGANPVVPEIRTTKVVRGDNLWNLSKRFYGYGPQYKVIFEANAAQIRDPNLIYPDQIFVVPNKPSE